MLPKWVLQFVIVIVIDSRKTDYDDDDDSKACWNLPLAANSGRISGMDETEQSLHQTAVLQCRLDLARKAFREFYAQCFWSYREDAEITEDKIEFVIRGLREHGGLAGHRIAAELCP